MQLSKWFPLEKPTNRAEWLRIGGRLAILVAVLGLIGSVIVLEGTQQPGFCRSCHIMEPYYQAWATSSHKDVPCVDCHYAPNLRSQWRGKLQGLAQVAKYFTGTEGTRPWAEIDDASCLRSGCHDTRVLEGRVDFNGVHFDHKPHLSERRRGRRLRCTSCHSQVVMGEHITVTTSTCFMCHFKGRPLGKPIGTCRGCHDVPKETITLPGGRQYQHADVVDRNVPCVSCHATVTTGDGFVPHSRCFVCHNFPVEDMLEDHEKLHQMHVTDHKVECTNCHEEITHGYESRRRVARLDCRQCHEGMHEATVALAEGIAASELGETRPRVGAMLAARVECIACHVANLKEAHQYLGITHIGSNEACIQCHGQEARVLLPEWKAFFNRRVAEVDRIIRGSRVNRDDLDRARHLVDLVRYGRGVHNNDLSRDLLAEAERIARGQRRSESPTATATSGAGSCLRCHIEGAPSRPLRFGQLTFRHQPHTVKAEISCDQCHEEAPTTFPKAEHGRVRVTEKDCVSCHHWQRLRCTGCHGRGPSATLRWRGLTFPHAPHTGAGAESCLRCHRAENVGRGMTTVASTQTCFNCHHKPGMRVACTKCHSTVPGKVFTVNGRSFPHAAHNPAKHLECGQCHQFTPQGMRVQVACANCHHKPGARCAACHTATGPTSPIAFRRTRFPHKTHVDNGLGCDDCHRRSGERMAQQAICNTCHHGMEKPKCADCHGNGPTAAVSTRWRPFEHARHIPLGLGCPDCHKEGEPEKVTLICDTCHEEAKAPAASDSPARAAR